MFSILIIAGIAAIILLSRIESDPPGTSPLATADPQIIANLTSLPQATALSGEAVTQLNELRAAVDACEDYSEARRGQMHQHIEWLIDASKIPPDIILALGANPSNKLIFGMATYTLSEWGRTGRHPDSCLVPIGHTLNGMLRDMGEEPFVAFEEIDITD